MLDSDLKARSLMFQPRLRKFAKGLIGLWPSSYPAFLSASQPVIRRQKTTNSSPERFFS